MTAGNQPELGMEVPEADRWTGGDLEYLHTAARFKANDPDRYEAVLRAVQDTGNISMTAKAFRVSRNTVYAMINEELGGMDKFRAALSNKLLFAAHQGVERINELMETCKDPVKAAMVTGIVLDKHAMVTGAPGLVVEHRVVHADAVQNFKAEMEAMRQRLQERHATGVVVEAEVAEPVMMS